MRRVRWRGLVFVVTVVSGNGSFTERPPGGTKNWSSSTIADCERRASESASLRASEPPGQRASGLIPEVRDASPWAHLRGQPGGSHGKGGSLAQPRGDFGHHEAGETGPRVLADVALQDHPCLPRDLHEAGINSTVGIGKRFG